MSYRRLVTPPQLEANFEVTEMNRHTKKWTYGCGCARGRMAGNEVGSHHGRSPQRAVPDQFLITRLYVVLIKNISRVYVLVACGPQRDSLVSEFTKMYCEQIIILCSWSVVGFGSICLIRGPSLCFSPNFGSEHWQTKFRRLAARAPPRLTLFALDDPAAAVELGLCAKTVHRR